MTVDGQSDSPEPKRRWSNFSIRTMLLLTFGAALLLSELSQGLPRATPPTTVVYLAACVLPAASYGYDVAGKRRGLITGAVIGAVIAVMVLPAVTTSAYVDGRYSIRVSVKSDRSSRITALSYTGLRHRDQVEFMIEHYSQSDTESVVIPNSDSSFTVSVRYGVKRSDLFGIESGYGQEFEVLLLRVSFEDGTHVFKTVTVPRRDEPRTLSVVVGSESG